MSLLPPKLFISYSWTTPDHEAWVLRLASDLRENAVDVVLDKWDLREGHDSHAFMEQMVTDKAITKVLLICDRAYSEKADGRAGGVGTETQIISPELYAKRDQDKFVAVVTERDEKGDAYLPAYYKSRIYIDLSDPSGFADNFEKLLRWVYDKPLHVKPELGKVPHFLSKDDAVSLGTASQLRRAVEAIRGGRDNWYGVTTEYLEIFAENLERFRLGNQVGERDEQLLQNISAFMPCRNELLELFFVLGRYKENEQTPELLHKFFERLFPYLDRPEYVTSWNSGDFDNFRFIVHELFLYAIAILVVCEKFNVVASFLRRQFYVPIPERSDTDGMVSFARFYRRIVLLDHRNQRLNLRSPSLHAELLEQRSHNSGVPFRQLMQADFILFIRDSLERLKDADIRHAWSPQTLVYAERQYVAFELFARSQSKSYFTRLRPMLNCSSKAEVDSLVLAFNDGRLQIPKWNFTSISPAFLMGYDKLESRP
jgi:hypothetical protein